MLPMKKYYLDSIFDDFMDEMEPPRGPHHPPFDMIKCDIYEKDGAYHIKNPQKSGRPSLPSFNRGRSAPCNNRCNPYVLRP